VREAAGLNQTRLIGPLAGVPIGVKDVIDTADMPTAYGSDLYKGAQPAADASCVHLVRTAGAVVIGKTVTTEFATASPGPTTNPFNSAHTPGGSSSGSCAAVGAGVLPLAFGTQTSGSTIRPAAYCGIVGFKPSFGSIDRTGVKPLGESLDVVGLLARDVGDVALLASVVMRRPALAGIEADSSLRVGFLRTPDWERVDADYQSRLEDCARLLGGVVDIDEDSWWADARWSQDAIFGWEVSAALAFERDCYPDRLTQVTRNFLKGRAGFDHKDYLAANAIRARLLGDLDIVFGECDVLITPAAFGGAPEGLASTGDPSMNTVWSGLGTPALTIPAGLSSKGLPLGLQLVAKPGKDESLIAAALWAECKIG
jgi:Asp-tRNA(Asn)/Glu-tRNA(Gln) amidotransferase A subunit family amidase